MGCKGSISNEEDALDATTDGVTKVGATHEAEGAAVTKKRVKNKSAKAAVEQSQLPLEEDKVAGKKKKKKSKDAEQNINGKLLEPECDNATASKRKRQHDSNGA